MNQTLASQHGAKQTIIYMWVAKPILKYHCVYVLDCYQKRKYAHMCACVLFVLCEYVCVSEGEREGDEVPLRLFHLY